MFFGWNSYQYFDELELSASYNILRVDIISLVAKIYPLISSSDISTSCNELTGTGQHKRVAAFLDKGSGHKRRRMSNGAGCSNTGKGTHEDGVANEQEDHDSTIYVPDGSFPALEGNIIVMVYHSYF